MAALAADLGVLRTQRAMFVTATGVAHLPHEARWGEGLLIGAIAPGAFSAIVLSLGGILSSVGVSTLGPLTPAFAWAAISTPLVSALGALTLLAGVVLAPFVPGRQRRKWALLLIGLLTWAPAFYALHVPGLIELP
jgi:hypothetical protein